MQGQARARGIRVAEDKWKGVLTRRVAVHKKKINKRRKKRFREKKRVIIIRAWGAEKKKEAGK